MSTSVQGDRGRKSPDKSLQGDHGKAPTVHHQVSVKYSKKLRLQQLNFINFIIYIFSVITAIFHFLNVTSEFPNFY